ncbi:foldase protein PrsA [Limnovirga soli]|uniref:PpiC domain-containing protein n=1 Tax=Limnovirga soli TaxID=2656915 RepID=A0A8J8FH03_9BACT|nr:peptidylprolyl isomerase [Limnovirga soli]NNV56843.1 hypothetical protein [Limnovirga soli]
MIKQCIAVLTTAVLYCNAVSSQTLFTYGAKAVNKTEFLQAFNKNPDTTGGRTQKLKEYLDMYINFKLKIQAAKDENLHKSSLYKLESDNFRAQLTDNFINEQADFNGLVEEAFNRSQKDILLAHVFVAVQPGQDSSAAYTQIKLAQAALESGKSFEEAAASFSGDDYTKQTKGLIGYITVFTLPYGIENVVYHLQPGTYSAIYKSNIGYHIFKNVSERPAIGKRKIQQILLATPESFDSTEKKAVALLADSIYTQLNNSASFETLLQKYSAPISNYEASNITEVGVGQYNADFENQVFALAKPGDISLPFTTAYGYNIIKLISISPVNKDDNDVVAKSAIQEKVQQDNRLAVAKDALIQQWMQQANFKAGNYAAANLWAYTDSSLVKGKPLAAFKNITPQTVLFSFTKQNITVANWLQYVTEAKQTGASYDQSSYSDLLQQFIKSNCSSYYREHIEDYNKAIAGQVAEFNEANLLFAVMDKHVWTFAAQDSVGLKKYYAAHKTNYTWQPGIGALVVSAITKEVIDSIAAQLSVNSSNWRNIIARYSNSVSADSSRFENGQLPVKQNIPMQKGFISLPEQNESGDAFTLVYIFDVYPQTAPRNFDDARGMVINDYQQVLEQKWITELKKKYPVKIYDAVLKSL